MSDKPLPGKIKNNPELAESAAQVNKFLGDKITRPITDFQAVGEKTSGLSAGYVVDRIEDRKRHLLKKSYKSLESTSSRQIQQDRLDLQNEFIASKFFQLSLKDRAAKISLVVTSKDSNEIHLTSKFIEEFHGIPDIAPSMHEYFDPSHPNLQKIDGFEKVIAACILAGDADYHAGNLGVVPKRNDEGNIELGEDGKPSKYNMVKIDYGRSWDIYESESELREKTASVVQNYSLLNIPCDVSKLKDSISHIAVISDDEITKMVQSSTHELIKQGVGVFSSNGLKVSNLDKMHKDSVDMFDQSYIEAYKKRRDQLKEMSRTLEIIEKIAPVDENWKQGKWLQDIRGKDPVIWASENNKMIEGKDPLEWRKEKDAAALLVFAGVSASAGEEARISMEVKDTSAKPKRSFFRLPLFGKKASSQEENVVNSTNIAPDQKQASSRVNKKSKPVVLWRKKVSTADSDVPVSTSSTSSIPLVKNQKTIIRNI